MAAAESSSRKKSRRPRLRQRWVRAVLLAGVFIAMLGAGFVFAAWALICRGGACPSSAMLEDFTPTQTSKLYAADGRFIAEIGLERRTVVKIGDIPAVVRNAFVITEDKRFYSHAGVDWVRVFGALKDMARERRVAGGASTITMQLAGNLFPEDIDRREISFQRKLREAKVAREIESRFAKDRILEMYLNQIELGSGAFGVESAAQRYFGKSVRDLNIAEAATLAALPKGPSRYNPRRFPERAVQRRNTIIELMRREGAINEADARLARAYPLRLANRADAGDLAPYFVEWVRRQLEERFGPRIYRDGLRVFTSLDVDMQQAAERAMERQMQAIEGGKFGRFPHPTYEHATARMRSGDAERGNESPYLQGAFVAIDPRNGAVRAMIGGRDFEDSKFNRATQALRQPGSTFKPIVYAAAVSQGHTANKALDDSPLSVPQVSGASWTPQNYDLKFEGSMTLRRALYQSRNIPSVRLGMDVGEAAVINMARRFGITTPIPAYPSIHLGAADVYPIELVASYSAFATLGVRADPIGITRVENARGEVLWEPLPIRAETLTRQEAFIMIDILRDVVRRGTAAGSVGSQFRIPSGGKTGTTNDGTDVWYVGFTPDLVAGVWMGFDRPKRIMNNAQGGRLSAPAWTGFMTEVYSKRPPPPDWPRPEGVISVQVDSRTGLLRNGYCLGDAVTEIFIAGTEPFRECEPTYDPFAFPDDTSYRASPASRTGRDTTARRLFDVFRIP